MLSNSPHIGCHRNWSVLNSHLLSVTSFGPSHRQPLKTSLTICPVLSLAIFSLLHTFWCKKLLLYCYCRIFFNCFLYSIDCVVDKSSVHCGWFWDNGYFVYIFKLHQGIADVFFMCILPGPMPLLCNCLVKWLPFSLDMNDLLYVLHFIV